MSKNDINHKDIYLELHQEYRLIHLLYHRNKNQHRIAIWWKWFSILKRSCSKVVEILQRRSLTGRNVTKLYNLIHKFLKQQINKLIYVFNSIIALGQFITLGVVLVGLLSRIYRIYNNLFELYHPLFKVYNLNNIIAESNKLENESQLEKILEKVSHEELGDVITDESVLIKTSNYDNNLDILNTLSEVRNIKESAAGTKPKSHSISDTKVSTKLDKKKKNKKKRSKSDIDSIFG
ncbi:hypothetical protein TPHA_0A01430 [Tetrapisispora phaffii CBS 4417]|uniref:RNase MRP protein 1 RNA binding domain-containing protein n=1 Tax=Tetrapisispora phaffii (strain ATCC 24235 / CBS 4417 / NBRC 1672 / NRRL Y-8282 / UCD 70-5) TaxID=1071381 RepID=G8BMU8_TETPH|nr:hypothetical protein TPHA_0A01430 [Tetrapisispora phaffii CBS 4417]CCE61226.1 hypothetical protein TPHA_0A01430 [Tetrapisispora phaffii CBS 4417]